MPQQVNTIQAKKTIVFTTQNSGNATFTTPQFDVSEFCAVELLYNCQFTGGTSPQFVFAYQAVDQYGNVYAINSVTVAGTGSQAQGVGLAGQSNHPVGMNAQIVCTLSGAPSASTASITVIGIP